VTVLPGVGDVEAVRLGAVVGLAVAVGVTDGVGLSV
jgi:hypothetical protein